MSNGSYIEKPSWFALRILVLFLVTPFNGIEAATMDIHNDVSIPSSLILYSRIDAASICMCRVICLIDVECTSFSLQYRDTNSIDCFFSGTEYGQIPTEDTQGAITFVKTVNSPSTPTSSPTVSASSSISQTSPDTAITTTSPDTTSATTPPDTTGTATQPETTSTTTPPDSTITTTVPDATSTTTSPDTTSTTTSTDTASTTTSFTTSTATISTTSATTSQTTSTSTMPTTTSSTTIPATTSTTTIPATTSTTTIPATTSITTTSSMPTTTASITVPTTETTTTVPTSTTTTTIPTTTTVPTTPTTTTVPPIVVTTTIAIVAPEEQCISGIACVLPRGPTNGHDAATQCEADEVLFTVDNANDFDDVYRHLSALTGSQLNVDLWVDVKNKKWSNLVLVKNNDLAPNQPPAGTIPAGRSCAIIDSTQDYKVKEHDCEGELLYALCKKPFA